MRSLSVRAKLMLLYLLVTFAGLVLFGLISFAALQYALLQGKKTHLQGREDRLLAFLKENKAKGVTLPFDDQLRNYALVTHEGNLFHIHNPDGTLVFPLGTPGPDGLASVSGSESDPKACVNPVFTSLVLDHQPVLVMCHMILLNGQLVRIHLGGSLEEQLEILRTYRKTLLLLMPGLLLLSIACGYLLSRHALKPVDRMTRAALDIGIGNLSARLPVPSAKDEVQHLAVAWNQLLARLEAAVSRLSQFSADASHDLRTSITIMLATAQLSLLRRNRSEPEYREDLGKIVTECRTAATLLDALLSLARSDNFIHEVAFKQINLCDLVVNGCRRVEDLAESSGIMLDWYLPKDPIHIESDELLLQRLLGILLDNAIRYTPEHGEIRAEVSLAVGEAIITVRDTGIGMSEDVRQKVFDRFYQADLRERKTQAGSGLGLSIARWIAEAHRADLTVESIPLKGSVFQIKFPVSTAPYAVESKEQATRNHSPVR
jgi:two-component system heavy metal sensor histidine kinase CusS